MKKITFLLILFFALFSFNADQKTNHPESTNVFICNSNTSTKYHLEANCRGLNACESKVIQVTKEEAFDKGKKTLCGWED